MLKLININKKIDEKYIHRNINLTFEKGLSYVILGPSGIGKSTLLNIIAGLVNDYTGEIENDFSSIAYSFQEGRLINWLSVKDNLNYSGGNEHTLDYYLELFKIEKLKDTTVKYLSGGEKQRVSLARAFYSGSPLILVDENLSSLNLKLKISIIEEMSIHLKKHNQTLIYVSHNIDEALLLADKIIIFSEEGNVHTVMDICMNKEERYKSFDKLALYEKQIIDIIMK